MDPNNAQVIWAGTGETQFSADAQFGFGLLKSTDEGQTWTQVSDPSAQFAFKSISRILINPANSSEMFVCTAPADLRTQENDNLPQTGQIYHSTDGGSTFTDITAASSIGANAPITDLVRRTDTGALLAAVDTSVLVDEFDQISNDGRSGIYRSTNDGQTWTKMTSGLPGGGSVGRISLAMSPANQSDVFALVGGSSSFLGTSEFQGLFASTDGGTTWHQMSISPNPFTIPNGGESLIGDNAPDQQTEYNQFLTVDGSNRVYMAGLAIVRVDGINLSAFTGQATPLSQSNPQLPNHPHTDQHFAVLDSNGSLNVCDDGGIFQLTNPSGATLSNTWNDLNGNLETLQFYTGSIALDSSQNLFAVGGTQDNGTLSFTGSNVWNEIDGGDGGSVAVDPSNVNVTYDTFVEYYGPQFLDQWVDGVLHDASNGFNFSDGAAPIIPLQVSPQNDNHMLVGTTRMYESVNAASTVSNPSATVRFSDTSGVLLSFGDYFTAVSYAPSNDQVAYAVSSIGRVFRRQSRGGTWTEADQGIPNNTFIETMSVDPGDPTHVLVAAPISTGGTFGARNVSGRVFETNNSGASWRDVTGDLPNYAVLSIVQDPRFVDVFYAGTTEGVFMSQNDGGNWTAYGTGLPDGRACQMNILAPGQLAAFLHGRSMWMTSTNNNLTITGPSGAVTPHVRTPGAARSRHPRTGSH
jgi:hypothetical protein